MSTEPRTATIALLVTKPLDIPEPDWCTGHDAETHAQFLPDVTHYGPETAITVNGIETLRAMLAQSPYAQQSSTLPVLYVENGDVTGAYTPAGVEELADAFAETAEQLRALGRQLAAVLADGVGE